MIRVTCLAAALLAHPMAALAAISWPNGQLLPSFSPPAATQDLITLRYPAPRWEANQLNGVRNATVPFLPASSRR
jgi:hypothetical protein